jgi:hypothetical protein
MNSCELARYRFNSLFAAHDAKNAPAAAQEERPPLKKIKEAATKNVRAR